MGIWLAFAPFAAFALVDRLFGSLEGLSAGFAVSAILLLRDWLSAGRAPKVLEIGTACLFGALALYTLLGNPGWSIMGVRLVVDAGLLSIVLVSLAIRQPFTLQYARESVPKEFWSSPLFLSTNRQITAAWTAAFAVMAAADAAAQFVEAIPLWIDIAATVAAFAAAFWFTRWSSARARRRAASFANPGGAS